MIRVSSKGGGGNWFQVVSLVAALARECTCEVCEVVCLFSWYVSGTCSCFFCKSDESTPQVEYHISSKTQLQLCTSTLCGLWSLWVSELCGHVRLSASTPHAALPPTKGQAALYLIDIYVRGTERLIIPCYYLHSCCSRAADEETNPPTTSKLPPLSPPLSAGHVCAADFGHVPPSFPPSCIRFQRTTTTTCRLRRHQSTYTTHHPTSTYKI